MTALLEAVGWALVHFVWQGGLIAVAVAAALQLTDRRSSNLRYTIGCAGLVLMVACPIATGRLVLNDANRARSLVVTSDDSATRIEIASHAQSTGFRSRDRLAERRPDAGPDSSRSPRSLVDFDVPRPDRVVTSIAVLWLIGVALLMGRLAAGLWQVRRLHKAAMHASQSEWQYFGDRLVSRLGMTAAARIVESALVEVPTVVGWLRPAIVLPIAALAALSPAQVEAVLAHELAHVRRHDYLVNLLQTLAETLLFYHPAVWWLSSRIRCCRGT